MNPYLEEKNSKREFWADIIKWFFGTVLIGGIGIYFTHSSNKTELELKRMEVDSKLIEAVSKQYNKELESQQAYLEFIRPFVTTEELREGVKVRLDSIKSKLDLLSSSRIADSAANDIKIVKNELNLISGEKREQLKNIESRLKSNQKPVSIDELIDAENRIAGDSVKSVGGKTIADIENIKKQIVQPVSGDDYILLGSPQTLWCKAGYYVEFNGTLRIGLNSLNNYRATVNFKDIEGGKEEPFDATTDLRINNKITLYSPGKKYKYLISLDYIGAAGKNPFTKAGYITVTTYVKN